MRPQVEGPQRWPRSTGIQKGPGRVPLQLGMGGIRIGGTTVGDPIVTGCGVGLKFGEASVYLYMMVMKGFYFISSFLYIL